DTVVSGYLTSINTTNSTSLSTGSAIYGGGVAIAKNVNVGGNLAVTGTANINGNSTFVGTVTVPQPVNSTDASTKAYVDSLISTAGVGLLKIGNVFSVVSSQPQITIGGSLTSLAVTGTSSLSGTSVFSATIRVSDNTTST